MHHLLKQEVHCLGALVSSTHGAQGREGFQQCNSWMNWTECNLVMRCVCRVKSLSSSEVLGHKLWH